MTKDRDVRTEKHPPLTEGAPVQPWHEEKTDVHGDSQVFRALKALGSEIESNKLEAARAHGALKTELVAFKDSVDERLTKQDIALARIGGQMDVLVPMKRNRPSSSETKAIVNEALEKSGTKFRRDLILKVVGGVVALGTSGAVLGWLLS